MPYERADAITIRYAEFSETSRVFSFYTREFGRTTMLAKGAKRKSSKLIGHVDLLSHCEVVFASRAKREGMHILTEASAHETFAGIRRDLERFYAACHAAALVETTTAREDPNEELFDELLLLLRRLARGVGPAIALFAFEVRLLGLCGFMPELARCVSCGKERRGRGVAFSLARGGVICSDCAPGEADLIETVPAGALGLLERLAQGKTTRLGRISMSPLAARRIRAFLNQYESYTLGKELRTMKHL